jgi:hypothetical protein
MTALFAFDPSEAEMKIPALQIPVNHLQDIFPPKSEPGCISIVPDPFQLLEMGFDTFVVPSGARVSWLIYLESI